MGLIMSSFAYNGPAWVELQPGQDFVEANGTVSSYGTVMNWSPQQRTAKGIKAVVDDDIPDGKVQTGSEIVDNAGTPRRGWTLVDAPPPPIPDGPTLSDWRVALILMERFADVEAAVIAARNSGSVDGAVAWQRFEYANHVYRAELLRLAPVFGFTEEDIDESLTLAAQVAQQAAA